MNASRPLIAVSRLSFGYDERRVVDDVSFAINERDFIAIVGPNGSGKTTLIKLLLGLLSAQSGTITRRIGSDQIGYVPQYVGSERNFPATVREILGLHAPPRRKRGAMRIRSPRGRKREDAVEVASEVPAAAASKSSGTPSKLPAAAAPEAPAEPHKSPAASGAPLPAVIPAELGIENIIDHRFATCSVGQQQRVCIALALLRNPRLLIMDEPTAGVDIEAKQRFYRLLSRLNAAGIAIILVTHEVTVLPPIINNVLCINNRICCQGPLNLLPDMLKEVYGDYVLHHHDH